MPEAVLETVQTEPAALLDVRAVGRLLNLSPRTVFRLSDAGRMPLPVRLNSSVRWPRQTILDWIADGCPSCRKGAGR